MNKIPIISPEMKCPTDCENLWHTKKKLGHYIIKYSKFLLYQPIFLLMIVKIFIV